MTEETDFLDELIAEGESATPGFTLMVEAALERRRLLRELAEDRAELGLSPNRRRRGDGNVPVGCRPHRVGER